MKRNGDTSNAIQQHLAKESVAASLRLLAKDGSVEQFAKCLWADMGTVQGSFAALRAQREKGSSVYKQRSTPAFDVPHVASFASIRQAIDEGET